LLAQPSLGVGHAPGKRPTGLVTAFLSDGPESANPPII